MINDAELLSLLEGFNTTPETNHFLCCLGIAHSQRERTTDQAYAEDDNFFETWFAQKTSPTLALPRRERELNRTSNCTSYRTQCAHQFFQFLRGQ